MRTFFDSKTDVAVIPHSQEGDPLKALDNTVKMLGPSHVKAKLLRIVADGSRLADDEEAGDYLVGEDGAVVIRSADPGFIKFAVVRQGYVRSLA